MSKTSDLVTATRRRASSEFTAHGLIHHSDAGSQYTALAFTEDLTEAGIAGSIGTVGDALDNALMESTIGLYKTELIKPHSARRNWSGLRAEVERESAEWVRWYNNERIHSSIDWYVCAADRHDRVRQEPTTGDPALRGLTKDARRAASWVTVAFGLYVIQAIPHLVAFVDRDEQLAGQATPVLSTYSTTG